MKLPARISDQLERFNLNYKTVKTSRSLHWVPQAGSVDLELEYEHPVPRTVSFTVPPDLAAIITFFEEKEQWSLEELSQAMELPMSHLRRRVHAWTAQGVLQEISPDRFQVDRRGPQSSAHKVDPFRRFFCFWYAKMQCTRFCWKRQQRWKKRRRRTRRTVRRSRKMTAFRSVPVF